MHMRKGKNFNGISRPPKSNHLIDVHSLVVAGGRGVHIKVVTQMPF
jgi:hypothetical protein